MSTTKTEQTRSTPAEQQVIAALRNTAPSQGDVLDALHRVKSVFAEIDGLYVGRAKFTELVAVTLVGGFNCIVFGPPGTAKSAVIRRLSRHVQQPDGSGLSYFGKLVFRSTVPSEIFGAVDMPALEQSVFRYNTQGMLPAVHLFFLDEVYNATSVILNSLMQIMNERVMMMGAIEVPTPTLAGFGASNVLPQEKDLQAFHDRWTLRTFVEYLDDGEIDQLIDRDDAEPDPLAMATLADVELLQYAVRNMVSLPKVARDALKKVWLELKDLKITISDRRLVSCKRVLRAAALYAGRFQVALEDFQILKDVLWQEDPETQRPAIERILSKIENPMNTRGLELRDAAVSVQRELAAAIAASSDGAAKLTEIFDAIAKANGVADEMDELYSSAVDQGFGTARLDEYTSKIKEIQDGLLAEVNKVKSVLPGSTRANRRAAAAQS